MKVAVISYGFPEYCIQQANGLARDCEVLLLLPREESAEYQHLLDPKVQLYLFDKPRLRQPVRQMVLASRLLNQIRRFKPDVIHYQQGHMWFNLVLPLLRSYPLVVTIHDPRYHAGDRDSQRTPQRLMDLGFRRADRVIVHGEALKQQVIELFSKKAEKVHVVPHVAIGRLEAPQVAGDDGRTILFFGRLWPYKGLKYLIEAEPLISKLVPEARIAIAGAGEDLAPYRRMMAQPEHFVVHNRFVGAQECDELFQQASIVVLPYIEATQSGVIPLAYSYAKPVVATRVGALAEAVEDGRTGRLVPPADANALARAIAELLQNPEARREMGAAGRRKLDQEWSPQAVARQAIEVYRRAIDDRTRQHVVSSRGAMLALENHESHS